jgi:hypothetical protein
MGQDGDWRCFCCVYRQKLLAGKWKENIQIFNEDFCLPLYLPLWSVPLGSPVNKKLQEIRYSIASSPNMIDAEDLLPHFEKNSIIKDSTHVADHLKVEK